MTVDRRDLSGATSRFAEEGADPIPVTAPTEITVAHVIHSLGAGGAEAVLVELARTATAAGLRLVVVGLSDARGASGIDRRNAAQLRSLGAVVHEMHSGRYDLTAAFALARLLRAERVDIVHTHLKHADVVGGVAARLAHRPCVSTLHLIECPRSRVHRLRVRAALWARRRLAVSVITLSSAQRRWYTECAGPDAPITIVPNGVSEPHVTVDRMAIRGELGVPPNVPMALCVGLVRPEKGHGDFLDAIRQVPDELPLVVAMAGDGPLLNDIRNAVESDARLRKRVRILGFREDVADLLAASDFVVQPSREDALPTALISALAAGKPAVATNVGGIPDIVGPECGFLVEAGCPAALAGELVKMVHLIRSDPTALRGMQQSARARYDDQFSARVWVQRLRAVYESVLGPRPVSGQSVAKCADVIGNR